MASLKDSKDSVIYRVSVPSGASNRVLRHSRDMSGIDPLEVVRRFGRYLQHLPRQGTDFVSSWGVVWFHEVREWEPDGHNLQLQVRNHHLGFVGEQ